MKGNYHECPNLIEKNNNCKKRDPILQSIKKILQTKNKS